MKSLKAYFPGKINEVKNASSEVLQCHTKYQEKRNNKHNIEMNYVGSLEKGSSSKNSFVTPINEKNLLLSNSEKYKEKSCKLMNENVLSSIFEQQSYSTVRDSNEIPQITVKDDLPNIGNQGDFGSKIKSDEIQISLSEKQLQVLNTIIAKQSVFFTGAAGTGKSYVLKVLILFEKIN